MDLTSITAALEEQSAQPVETLKLDISKFVNQEPETVILELKELEAWQLFSIPKDADGIRKRYPLWPSELCQSIGILARGHVAPLSPGPIGLFYAQIAEKNSRLFQFILMSYRRAFPNVETVGLGNDELKNDSADDQAIL